MLMMIVMHSNNANIHLINIKTSLKLVRIQFKIQKLQIWFCNMWSFAFEKFEKKRVLTSLHFTCVTHKVEADQLNHTFMDIYYNYIIL